MELGPEGCVPIRDASSVLCTGFNGIRLYTEYRLISVLLKISTGYPIVRQ